MNFINLLEVDGSRIYEDMFIGMRYSSGGVTNQSNYKFVDGSAFWGDAWDDPSTMSSTATDECVYISRSNNNHYAWRNGDCFAERSIVCQDWPARSMKIF